MIDLSHTLNPYKTKFWILKVWTRKMKEGKFKEWTWKMKEWTRKIKEKTIITYLLIKKDISHGILPPSTTTTKKPIGAPWDGETWLLVPVPSIFLPRPMSNYSTPLSPLFNPLHRTTSSQMIPYLPNILSNRDSKFLKKIWGCSAKIIASVSWTHSCRAKEALRSHLWTTK